MDLSDAACSAMMIFFNIGNGSFYNNKKVLGHFDFCEVMFKK
jgi:hypothetical protein